MRFSMVKLDISFLKVITFLLFVLKSGIDWKNNVRQFSLLIIDLFYFFLYLKERWESLLFLAEHLLYKRKMR